MLVMLILWGKENPMKTLFAALLMTSSVFATDLSIVPTQDLLNEIAIRLGTNQLVKKGSLTAYCNGADLTIDVYSEDGSSSRGADLSLSTNCAKALELIKQGEFYGYSISAFCHSSTLYIVNALANDAQLSLETKDMGLPSKCEEAQNRINIL